MVNRPADHAMGLELQIEELTEERTRAHVQGREGDAASLDGEISELQAELAATAEQAAEEGPERVVAPRMHHESELGAGDG